jgi:uncharacterized protein
MSKRTHDPRRLDVAAACADAASLAGEWPLGAFARLLEPGARPPGDGAAVTWSARFEQRPVPGAPPQRRLHLQATAGVIRECQRCLQPVRLALAVDRPLRFVDDEATAAALDADCEEDVLVAERPFDLQALVEDELLLAMPLVPLHEACSMPLTSGASGSAPEPDAVHPFAALAALRGGRKH